jgi:hypothetical protein
MLGAPHDLVNLPDESSGADRGHRFWNRLYRQNKDGSFTDVTEAAGFSKAGAEIMAWAWQS